MQFSFITGRDANATFLPILKTTLEECIAVQHGIEASIPAFDVEPLQSAGITSSSSGDLDKLGLLSRWRPSTSSTITPAIVIDKLVLAVRNSWPAVVCTYWQYDGKLELHLQGARKWHSDEAWAVFEDAVMDGLRGVIYGRGNNNFEKSNM